MNIYDFTTMTVSNSGQTLPMRVDTEGGMIDVWSKEANNWIWSDEATEVFKTHLFSQNTHKRIYFMNNNQVQFIQKSSSDQLDDILKKINNKAISVQEGNKERMVFDLVQALTV